jgi:hypothetical protein
MRVGRFRGVLLVIVGLMFRVVGEDVGDVE